MLLLAWSLTKTLFLNVLGKDHHSEDVAAGPSGSPGQAAVRLQQLLLLAWSLTKTLFLNVLGKDHHSEDVAAGPSGSPGQAAVRLQQLLLLAWSLTKTFPTHSHPNNEQCKTAQLGLNPASAM